MEEEKVDDSQETQRGTSPESESPTEEKNSAPEDQPAAYASDEEGVKWQAALAYLPLVCLIPLLLNRDDPFIQRHAKQGFILFVIEIVALLLKSVDAIWDLIIYICLAAALVGAAAILIRGEIRIPLLTDLAEKIHI